MEILRKFLYHVWNWRRFIAYTLVSVFGFYFVDPIGSFTPPIQIDVATTWNNTIRKLAIEPLYPPSEDFNVGDVFIQITDAGLAKKLKSNNGTLTRVLYKAIRVEHIDLDTQVKKSLNFTKSTPCDGSTVADANCNFVNPIEVEEMQALSLNQQNVQIVAFPGVDIVATGGVDVVAPSLNFFGLRQKRTSHLVIGIPQATTVSADVPSAYAELLKWCFGPKKALCTDRFSRTLLASTFGEIAMLKDEEKNTNSDETGVMIESASSPTCLLQVELFIVTRTYLTRQIIVSNDGTKTSNLNAPQEVSIQNSDSTALKQTDDNSSSGPKVAVSRHEGDSISFNQRYTHPVVFGFRALHFLLGGAPLGAAGTAENQKEQSPCT